MRGEFIPLRGIPVNSETAQRELSYEWPLPGPLPELPRVVEKGTHWVDAALNAHKGTNLLAMDLPPVPEVTLPELPTMFPEIACPPEAIFSTDTFINGQLCPPGPIQGGPPDAEPIKLRPANSETEPIKSQPDAPGARPEPIKSRPDALVPGPSPSSRGRPPIL